MRNGDGSDFSAKVTVGPEVTKGTEVTFGNVPNDTLTGTNLIFYLFHPISALLVSHL